MVSNGILKGPQADNLFALTVFLCVMLNKEIKAILYVYMKEDRN